VITGRAPEPVLVRIADAEVEFVPAAGRYWGLETAALEGLIREETGPGAKVLSTGPAGENLVPFACLSTDQFHKAGRGGAGAVMGSKNLKALAVRGTGAVKVGDSAANPSRQKQRAASVATREDPPPGLKTIFYTTCKGPRKTAPALARPTFRLPDRPRSAAGCDTGCSRSRRTDRSPATQIAAPSSSSPSRTSWRS